MRTKKEWIKRITLTDALRRKKWGEGEPLRRMEKKGEEIRFIIHHIQVALKLKANKMCLM